MNRLVVGHFGPCLVPRSPPAAFSAFYLFIRVRVLRFLLYRGRRLRARLFRSRAPSRRHVSRPFLTAPRLFDYLQAGNAGYLAGYLYRGEGYTSLIVVSNTRIEIFSPTPEAGGKDPRYLTRRLRARVSSEREREKRSFADTL